MEKEKNIPVIVGKKGDKINIEAEKRIIEITNKSRLKADIIKIPHHGSKTSSTRELLERVLPKFLI